MFGIFSTPPPPLPAYSFRVKAKIFIILIVVIYSYSEQAILSSSIVRIIRILANFVVKNANKRIIIDAYSQTGGAEDAAKIFSYNYQIL